MQIAVHFSFSESAESAESAKPELRSCAMLLSPTLITSSKFGVGGGNLSYSELMFTSSKFGVGSEKFHQK